MRRRRPLAIVRSLDQQIHRAGHGLWTFVETDYDTHVMKRGFFKEATDPDRSGLFDHRHSIAVCVLGDVPRPSIWFKFRRVQLKMSEQSCPQALAGIVIISASEVEVRQMTKESRDVHAYDEDINHIIPRIR